MVDFRSFLRSECAISKIRYKFVNFYLSLGSKISYS